MGSRQKSINNYEINDLMSNYNLLGSLNFYKTSVKISNSKFFNIHSEDAVNIIDSNFNLENVIFDDIKYDAIDFDFTIGKLSNLKFKNIGNDTLLIFLDLMLKSIIFLVLILMINL